jgi:hypothetical protein
LEGHIQRYLWWGDWYGQKVARCCSSG